MARVPGAFTYDLRSACLEGVFFFFTKRGDLDSCGTGCPLVVQFWNCFCRRGGRLPFAVSGRKTCSKLEGRLPSMDPGQGTFVDTGAGCPAVVSGSRGFCRREDWLSSTARAPETRVRGLTPHCRRDPRNTKGDKTNSLGLLSAWAPWRSEVGVWCGDSLVAAPYCWEAL